MYSFRNVIPEKGVEATLDMIRDMGITEIEGGVPGDLSPEEYRQMCEERGIRIPSTGTGYEQLVRDPVSVAERARALGASYVMTAWIPHDVGNFNYENARQAVEDFNTAGKVLSEHGITFKYHIHGYEFWPHEDGTLMDYIIQNTDPDYVSFQLDVFWAHFGGADPVDLLETYGDRWVSLHLKDMETGTEKDMTGLTDYETNVVLGTGEVDIEGVIRTAKEIGIEHYFLEDESSRVLEQLPQSIEYLKSLRK
jgi:sugar phosphate isomerase/epimerase